jgi:hypothetical protein
MHAAIRRHEFGRISEKAQVVLQGWLKLGFV